MSATKAQDPNQPALPTDVAAWIGRRSGRSAVIEARMEDAFRATLAPHLAAQPGAPLGIFWCLAPDLVDRADLGADGHPRTGLVMPALPYPRRMWAGGELTIHGAFGAGDEVAKTSTIEDIAFKTGGSGRLAFVTVRHDYRVGGRLMLGERQDVVYRDLPGTADGAKASVTPPRPAVPGIVLQNWEVAVDPVMMFRYSALTFNGHRIHYDQPYATGVEGYDGLVVHGPLQATLMLNLAADVLGGTPERFSYRGHAPLICGAPIRVEAGAADGGLTLRVVSAVGDVTMTATALRHA